MIKSVLLSSSQNCGKKLLKTVKNFIKPYKKNNIELINFFIPSKKVLTDAVFRRGKRAAPSFRRQALLRHPILSFRGAERRGNLIQFNTRLKPRGNLLLVTHIYEYVK